MDWCGREPSSAQLRDLRLGELGSRSIPWTSRGRQPEVLVVQLRVPIRRSRDSRHRRQRSSHARNQRVDEPHVHAEHDQDPRAGATSIVGLYLVVSIRAAITFCVNIGQGSGSLNDINNSASTDVLAPVDVVSNIGATRHS